MTDSWRKLFDRADDHGVTLDAIRDTVAERRND